MKKKLLLIPIALTTLTPTIAIVGCGEKEPEWTPIELEYDNLDYESDKITLDQGKKYVGIIDLTKIPSEQWTVVEGANWTFRVLYIIDDFGEGKVFGHVDSMSIDGKVYKENEGYEYEDHPDIIRIRNLSSTCLKQGYNTIKFQFVPTETKSNVYLQMHLIPPLPPMNVFRKK